MIFPVFPYTDIDRGKHLQQAIKQQLDLQNKRPLIHAFSFAFVKSTTPLVQKLPHICCGSVKYRKSRENFFDFPKIWSIFQRQQSRMETGGFHAV